VIYGLLHYFIRNSDFVKGYLPNNFRRLRRRAVSAAAPLCKLHKNGFGSSRKTQKTAKTYCKAFAIVL